MTFTLHFNISWCQKNHVIVYWCNLWDYLQSTCIHLLGCPLPFWHHHADGEVLLYVAPNFHPWVSQQQEALEDYQIILDIVSKMNKFYQYQNFGQNTIYHWSGLWVISCLVLLVCLKSAEGWHKAPLPTWGAEYHIHDWMDILNLPKCFFCFCCWYLCLNYAASTLGSAHFFDGAHRFLCLSL